MLCDFHVYDGNISLFPYVFDAWKAQKKKKKKKSTPNFLLNYFKHILLLFKCLGKHA